MAGSRYANSLCSNCGKKIILHRPKHDSEKIPEQRATLWLDFQRERAVRCARCARNVCVQTMKTIAERYNLDEVEDN